MRSPGKAGEGQFLQGDNFFYQGCASNWYMTICAPLGSKYLSEAVWLQREEVTEWDSLHALCLPRYSSPHHPTEFPGPTSQTLGFYTHGQGPPGSGKAAAFQEGVPAAQEFEKQVWPSPLVGGEPACGTLEPPPGCLVLRCERMGTFIQHLFCNCVPPWFLPPAGVHQVLVLVLSLGSTQVL
ncbi:hypothetical protein GHT09_016910 [Marmota monax]|uniref:Uncharacterized protein n=1 Tax=Marmota monax TaxID=9995 RepID=A0A834Q688_MARMO|nr:hypothetical protein GHT09_016910 [Marmota monax]